MSFIPGTCYQMCKVSIIPPNFIVDLIHMLKFLLTIWRGTFQSAYPYPPTKPQNPFYLLLMCPLLREDELSFLQLEKQESLTLKNIFISIKSPLSLTYKITPKAEIMLLAHCLERILINELLSYCLGLSIPLKSANEILWRSAGIEDIIIWINRTP